MKIGIYDPYIGDMGGGEKYMLTIASILSKDHDVTLFWNRKEDLDRVVDRFGIDMSRINIAANIFSPSISFMKRFIESRKYDAMIVLSDGSVPVVASPKLFLHIQQPLPSVKPNIKTKIKLSRVTKVFVNSYFTKSFIDKELGINSVVLYPPVDLHPKREKKENIVLHVGRLRVRDVRTSVNGKSSEVGNYKKQDVMVEAYKKIADKMKNWKFVIATSINEEDESALEDLKKKAKGAPIEFLVNKSNNELWESYSKAKIYWHASGYGENLDEHPELAEHFGISTVEAMGAGAVPVVINGGGQKEIIEDGFSGFLWNTLDDLEEKTLMLAKDSDILEKMSENAKKRARDFAGDRFSNEVERLVNNG